MTNRELFIQENQQDWKAKGDRVRGMREKAEVSPKEMADYLKISVGRIRRFEAGWPVQDAKLIEATYRLVLKYMELSKAISEVNELAKED